MQEKARGGVLPSLISLLFLPLILCSCMAVGPDFKELEAPKLGSWSEDEALRQVSEGEEVVAWWQEFNDPTLTRLVESAVVENLSLQIAALRVVESRAQLGIAVGAQFPQKVNAAGSYKVTKKGDREVDGPSGIGLSRESGTDQISSVGIDATWELDMWGRFRRGVEASEAALYASYASYDNVLVSLTAEIARVYIGICSFQRRIEIAKQNEALQERSLEITQVRFRNAATTELDVRRAEGLLMQTKALIPVLERGLRQYEHALALLLGKTPAAVAELLPQKLQMPQPPSSIVVGIPADLLRRRPDIRRAEFIAAAQSARIGVAKADLFPSFYLGGALGVAYGDDYLKGSDQYSYALIQPGFSWKILNFGRIKNSVRAQDARFQQAILAYENSVLKAYQEVEDAMVSHRKYQEQVGYLAQGVTVSKRSVELAMVQYRDGVVSYSPVIETQANLARSQDKLVVSRSDALLSVVALYKALGGGWQSQVGKEILPAKMKKSMQERSNWGDYLEHTPLIFLPQKTVSPYSSYTLGRVGEEK